ncbi:hypothetical protein ACP70R_027841 [Stipagrostis hirtigluma subsp. patula]
MELFVSTTASARATAPISFASFHRGALPLRRRLPARDWRCASAAVPDPAQTKEPATASSTVVVTDKPHSPADENGWGVDPASSGYVEAAVPAKVSSGVSWDFGGWDDIVRKLHIEVTPTSILIGSGAFLALWILFSVVSAIAAVPLLPKLLELVGIGYSIWFTARYLIFKESRDELFAKFEDLKQRII